jgi:hypothetical protein
MSSSLAHPVGLLELAHDLAEVMRQMRVLHGSALSLISVMESAAVVEGSGYTGLAGMLTDLLRVTPRRAHRLIAQAGLVAESVTPTGHVTPARLPLVREVLAEGVLDADHVDAIVESVKKIPTWAAADATEVMEHHLVDIARSAPSSVVRSHGAVLLERIDADGTPPKEDLAVPRNVFRSSRDASGWMRFSGVIDPEAAEELDSLLGALGKPDGPCDERHPTQRLGDAFCDVVHHALTSDTLPTRGGEKPHLNATMDLTILQKGVGSATLAGGAPLPAAAARRLACDAGIIPMVMNGVSVPLDVGRTHRLVTPAQRTALNTRDKGCAFPNCPRPAPWADAHHIKHWLDGGATDLANLVLLCRRHHRMIHHSEWEVRARNGLPEFIPPRWIDPHQVPQRNRLHRE